MQALQAMRGGPGRGGFPPHAAAGFHVRPPPRDQMSQDSQNAAQWRRSKYMEPEEIDTILRIQWKSLHNGPPYQEDYYYQVRKSCAQAAVTFLNERGVH